MAAPSYAEASAEFGAYALEYVALSETRMPTARLERDKAILGAVDTFLRLRPS